MVNENIVRDRTLVLRVLVPGLHTQLSDKLLAKQEAIKKKKAEEKLALLEMLKQKQKMLFVEGRVTQHF